MKKMTIGTLMLALAFVGGWFAGSANGLRHSTDDLRATTDQCRHLTHQCQALQDELTKDEAEIIILGAALKKVDDENKYLVQQKDEADISFLNIAKATLEPENFVVLNERPKEMVFRNFRGTLQWFASSEPIGSPISDYSQLEGPDAPGVAIEDRGEEGFRLAVPAEAKAYSLKGTSVNGRNYTVDFMSD